MKSSKKREFFNHAKNRHLYCVSEKAKGREVWKVFSSSTGVLLATIYPDTWRVLLHFGSGESHTATDGYEAFRIVSKLNGLQ